MSTHIDTLIVRDNIAFFTAGENPVLLVAGHEFFTAFPGAEIGDIGLLGASMNTIQKEFCTKDGETIFHVQVAHIDQVYGLIKPENE